jgi:hypothetical protein
MSELLRRASEQFAAQQNFERQVEEERAAKARRAAELHAEYSGRGTRRALQFVDLMRTRNVPTAPIYLQIYRRVPSQSIMHPYTSELARVSKLGEGWLIREEWCGYDEEPTRALFLADDYKLYECGELRHPSEITRFPVKEPYYEVWGMHHEDDTYSLDRLALLGTDEGLDILARGLVINGVTS